MGCLEFGDISKYEQTAVRKPYAKIHFSNGKVLYDSMILDDDYVDECQIYKSNNIVTYI